MENFEYITVHVPANKRKQAAALNKYGAQGWELVGAVRLVLGARQGTAQLRRHRAVEAPAVSPLTAAAGGFMRRMLDRMEASNAKSSAARKTGTKH